MEECPDVFYPVCGTNGETYDNECKLKAESCADGTDVGLKHRGVCGTKISLNFITLFSTQILFKTSVRFLDVILC